MAHVGSSEGSCGGRRKGGCFSVGGSGNRGTGIDSSLAPSQGNRVAGARLPDVKVDGEIILRCKKPRHRG